MSEVLEHAIPEYLQQERTKPSKLPASYVPPFPAYVSRYPRSIKEIVMAIIGVQYRSKDLDDGVVISQLSEFMTASSSKSIQPTSWELASVTDQAGAYNVAIIAYWPSAATHKEWGSASGFEAWWQGLEAGETHGWFLEVLSPSMDRWEDVYSGNEAIEGAAHMREGVSGPIHEHAYWGSMRDRIPAAQTDDLAGEAVGSSTLDGGKTASRVQVPGRKNLAVIRSGQDWSATLPEERRLYLETMHPVLLKGMNFLRDHGSEIGCYSCRLMSIIDAGTQKPDKDRTFGLAYFDDLASLEKWSREHKTHLDIFGGFLQYAKKLNNEISLEVFHEVLVLRPEQQYFEYIGCHTGTGMLAALTK
ncbi:phenylacetaldoxime dehydratase [Lindgomyces ingoldianus]|uniref:Phenylacetaldoxime dehydratase n=1 Tax=Lindgomyces ingoldianus TaxID=673940 RepID=A0ACB6QS34_9PLEO|nr:phenylacetaldoxime dehydratase [Lindgomyces ingoldianus]KAF2469798.1 phenylacetaldoxime dehydratase [Lindgomyces ingoldianus]